VAASICRQENAFVTERTSPREQILDEIAHLEREVAQRRATTRPPPASVLRAYQIVLAREYDRLERFDAGRRSIIVP
jgi:hypothetical protein